MPKHAEKFVTAENFAEDALLFIQNKPVSDPDSLSVEFVRAQFSGLTAACPEDDSASARKFFFADAVLADERIQTQGYRPAGMYSVTIPP